MRYRYALCSDMSSTYGSVNLHQRVTLNNLKLNTLPDGHKPSLEYPANLSTNRFVPSQRDFFLVDQQILHL